MYLFNRTRQAKTNKLMEATAAAVDIASDVTSLTGMEIYVWTFRFGAPVGTMMWSARLDSQTQLFEATEKMVADQGYVDKAMAMAELFDGPAVDAMFRVISGTPSDAPSKFIETTQATMANGKYAEAMEFGVKMQQHVATALGMPSIFGAATYGGFADVGWIVGGNSMADIDRGDDWQTTDTDYHALVQSAAGLFVEGSGQRALLEKIN